MKILKMLAAFLALGWAASFSAETPEDKDMEQTTETEQIEARALYDAFKQNKADPYKKRMRIKGIATYVGPDVYALPSVELSETEGVKGRALCVLPFGDYLKLRHVSKKDTVVMEGDVRGFAEKYDIVVVKESKIITVNGKKPGDQK